MHFNLTYYPLKKKKFMFKANNLLQMSMLWKCDMYTLIIYIGFL